MCKFKRLFLVLVVLLALTAVTAVVFAAPDDEWEYVFYYTVEKYCPDPNCGYYDYYSTNPGPPSAGVSLFESSPTSTSTIQEDYCPMGHGLTHGLGGIFITTTYYQDLYV